MEQFSRLLLRFSAIFALIGAFIGSHMAGAGGYEFKSLHAHILVVGWLSLFAWAVFYKVFPVKLSLLAKLHVLTAILGSIGLTVGMWLYYVKPFQLTGLFPLLVFILGGSILLISFLLFVPLTFISTKKD